MMNRKMRISIIAIVFLSFCLIAAADEDVGKRSSSVISGIPSILGTSNIQQETGRKKQVSVIPYRPDPDIILQGGDNISTATPIPNLPFHDTGTTTGYTEDYDEMCPYGSSAPDVVYSYVANTDMSVYITLCNGSEYDTKLYVYENGYTPGNPHACNDDACPDYVSRLINVFFAAGNTYYIVIDGYGGQHGNYVLDIFELVECVDCPPGATPEGEPDCHDGYDDHTNGGCGSVPVVFGDVSCGETICGESGTFLYDGAQTRDTDWYNFYLAEDREVTITAMAEFDMWVFIIEMGPDIPCEGFQILYNEIAPICEEYSFSVNLTAGGYWIWVAPESFEGVPCGSPYYFTVTCGGQNEIPTLSEWGMVILGLLLLAVGTMAVVRRRKLPVVR
ncbi:MAG: IPTL-CTERM sorting domain-containing protein [candidate division Zixibacteria bacterium]